MGPDGTQEWHDVQQGGEPPVQSFDLEMQVGFDNTLNLQQL